MQKDGKKIRGIQLQEQNLHCSRFIHKPYMQPMCRSDDLLPSRNGASSVQSLLGWSKTDFQAN